MRLGEARSRLDTAKKRTISGPVGNKTHVPQPNNNNNS
jgi:hypothetical protein